MACPLTVAYSLTTFLPGSRTTFYLNISAENGPFKINKDLTLEDNPDGWDVSHNMIYVDQPIGTGYSYSTDPADTVHNEKGRLCTSSW